MNTKSDVFEFKGAKALSQTIKATALSDQSDGTIGKARLTCDGHGYLAGSLIYHTGFTGDLAYLNGLKKIIAVATNTYDVLIRQGEYAAGTPAGTETARVVITLDEFYWLEGFEVHLSAASATSENLVVTKDANAGSEFDSKLYDKDMNTVQDIVNIFDIPINCDPNDLIVMTWANSNSRIWGVKFMAKRKS